METSASINNLSQREIEIMQLVACGKLNKEIADNLDCKTTTIKKHLQHIFPKLGVQNRTEAVIKFMEITGKLKLGVE
jgi:DNA-binding NarL/FixJ family response regulator